MGISIIHPYCLIFGHDFEVIGGKLICSVCGKRPR